MALRELSVEKVYKLPKEIEIVKYKGINLVIYTEGCNWLVLSNEQLKIFNKLYEGADVESLLDKFNTDDVMSTLIQLEAKQFENIEFKESGENNLFVYLTNRCNLRCKHCYMYSGEIDIDELSILEWKNIFSEFKNSGGTNVTFSGGEITVYKGYEELLAYSKKIGLINTVLSNGTLWTDESINQSYKNIDEIQISLDGYDEVSNAKVRGEGYFNKAVETIKKFAKLGVKVSVAVTPLYHDIDTFILNFKRFAKEFLLENPSIFIKLNLELIKGRDVNLTDEENIEYKKKLKQLVNEIYPDYYVENFILNYKNQQLLKNCGYGEISIAPNGDIYMCNRIHELESKYNIRTNDIKEIMEYAKEIRKITSVNNVDICQKCPIKYICGGGCRLKYKNILIVDSKTKEYMEKYVCPIEYKNSFYDKMIDSNEYFYKD